MNLRAQDILKLHLELVGIVAAVALLVPALSAASVVTGGVVMGANFWLMGQIMRRALDPGQTRHPALVAGLLLGKFSLFLGLLALLFWRAPIEPLSFGLGATLLLVACVFAALRPRAAVA